MSYLKRISSFLFSRRMLLLVALALVAVAVWFVGPLLAFGTYRPLSPVAMRVTVIVMLCAFALFWVLRWPVSVIGVAALCLLIWHLGPLFGVRDTWPLEPESVRVVLIAALVFAYAVYGLYRLWHELRNNEALLKRLLNPVGEKTEQGSRAELRVLDSVVSKAIRQLKRMRHASGGLGRLLESRRYLYELPWFMLIGAPGSGKTTAILNSGLEFPLAEQMGALTTRGQQGTANCEWWFTNEAVLIDTAGRYAEQREPHNEGAAATNATEWRGLLGLLRKHRPLAPVNGAILTLSVADLVGQSQTERTALAAALRARLGELRHELGIRFPVYVLVTKLDMLPGFPEYFQSLTAEGRAQIWGFTLPYHDERQPAPTHGWQQACQAELRLLGERIDAGLNNRLLEEFESDRRKRLYALPQEFRSLAEAVVETVGLVFLDSRYDDTHVQTLLRGVYFTSAEQTDQVIAADRATLLQRLRRKLARLKSGEDANAQIRAGTDPHGYRSYFLRNLFQQVIVSEAHLVRPNLMWELRFRLMRVGGHLLSLFVFGWLAFAMKVSFENNSDYLAFIAQKTSGLESLVRGYRKKPAPEGIRPILAAARDLPQRPGLDLEHPGGAYRYGLYVAPAVIDASNTTYVSLLRQSLLPQVARRIESALNERIGAQDADGVYQTLTLYLMLYDAAHYDAKAIRTWVLRDWERSDSALASGSRAAMAQHLESLFVDQQPVTPGITKNADLIQRARTFLNNNPAPKRLYERAMSAMQDEAPEDMTLARAVGVQGMSVFAMADGKPLDQGVPGLYTYEGYHDVFRRRLPEFIVQAQKDDSWVMGRQASSSLWPSALRNTSYVAMQSSLADEVRRQYLTDYATHWQHFLASIRPVAASGQGADGTLALDLDTLRTLASPDSPLARLARLAVHETSLSVVEADATDPALTDAAMTEVGRQSRAARAARVAATMAKRAAEQRPEQKLEKELVDNRFAALREVVTGHADTGAGPEMANVSVGGKALQLNAIIDLINEQYTRLVVADNALAAGSMPPAADIGTRLQTEAAKLPAPLQAVLSGISVQTAQKVGREIGALLGKQMESSVGDACRRAIEGRYPFANSTQEVDIDDFNRVFAAGGLLDDFFQKSLAAYVDTQARPWRYKAPSPGMPPIQGPSLEPFQRAVAIRDIMFREPGAKRMSWKMTAKVASIDPEITDLSIDIDGQGQRYAHGPVTPFPITWPGPRSGALAEITANPRLRPDTSTIQTTGPWALFRLIERGRLIETASSSRLLVNFAFDRRHASLEFTTSGQMNPLTSNLLAGFRCPGAPA